MGAVVSAIGDAIGGVVEAVGDAVEDVGQALGDVGEAIDDYVIQPILDDPLTAVATVAGAAILGPMAAPYLGAFGTAAGAVGAGVGAFAGNTTAGLVQGEEFDEALKGGLIAGVTAGATKGAFDYFGGGDSAFSGRTETGLATLPDEAISLPSNDLTLLSDAVPDNIPGGATTAAVPPPPPVTPSPLEFVDDAAANTVDDIATASTSATPPSPLAQVSTPDYLNTSTAQSNVGLRVPKFDPMASLPRDLSGNIDYSLTAGMQNTGPGLQFPSTTGGPGLSIAQEAIPDFTYSMNSLDPSIRGMGDIWTGESGKLYGMGSPAGTINQYGFTPTPETIQYASTPSVAPKSLADKLKSFELGDINKQDVTGLAGKVVDYAIENPLTTLAGITLATGALTQDAPPSAQPQPGSTRDPSFTRPMDIYNYVRQQNQYGDDFTKYGQTGGEFQFFTPARFDLVNPPANARHGGLMKFANGGQMPMRRPPMGGLAQAMQTGNMPPAGGGMRGQMMPPQQGNMPQGRPQPVNRNPKTSYYQYGTPPTKMANGGALNMVRSYNVGGGADGRSDDVNAVLSDGEYVFDAETVALLGNGSSEAGADRLDQMREQIRKQKGQNLAKGKISPDAKSPLSYLKRS